MQGLLRAGNLRPAWDDIKSIMGLQSKKYPISLAGKSDLANNVNIFRFILIFMILVRNSQLLGILFRAFQLTAFQGGKRGKVRARTTLVPGFLKIVQNSWWVFFPLFSQSLFSFKASPTFGKTLLLYQCPRLNHQNLLMTLGLLPLSS